MFFNLNSTPFLLAILSLPLLASSQTQAADGVIVPFTSKLPACASLCGKLFDVQGACSPPAIASVSQSCFCGDPRLTSFLQSGTAGVSSVCGPTSCTAAADLEKIQSWYESYCNVAQTTPTTTTGTTPTGTQTGSSTPIPASSQTKNQGWFATHWKWVVMIIVIILGLAVIWIGAFILRRRYIRKREKEIEMRPPVAWGPHQMQGATGGYGDGVSIANGGAAKEARGQVVATPADATKRESKGWLKKSRR
ncbi:hypothetical protein D0Z07_2659 [Hyphodiscus hymeniophilus]|uniref:Integral membrane protein n=1 Tax=Hyphodiscus hymeniophilus TaxID=353542 RepID=A0A9P7AZ88_9HELO|nr:hypothetical protein D0Z07_2659 [Hyphodiscus hymeniophilus]